MLLFDVMVPQLNGVDLGLEFQASHPRCKVLLFSGRTTSSDVMRDANARGHKFEVLTKSLHPSDLLAAILEMTRSAPATEG